MGFIDVIKSNRKKSEVQKQVDYYFKMMNGYAPVFSSFEGSIYEMGLTRAAIHTFATHCSKLLPEVEGAGNQKFERMLQNRPNPNMNTAQYLYKLATLYETDNTAFISPLYEVEPRPVGFYPVKANAVEHLVYNNNDYFKFMFSGGTVTLPKDEVGVLNKFNYKSDFYGASNKALEPTLDLITVNNQGIVEGVKNSASLRFMAKLASVLQPKDLKNERKRLAEDNLGIDNNDGVFLYDAKYEDIKQITSQPFTVNAAQMREIEESVFTYFGTNKNILQNKFTPDEWNAYYEGKIEPFAIQASLTHTSMKFTDKELAYGNKIIFTANRLQYESTETKLSTVTSLFDRGMLTQNQACDIFQLPHIEGGDKYYIRKEYMDMTDINDNSEVLSV